MLSLAYRHCKVFYFLYGTCEHYCFVLAFVVIVGSIRANHVLSRIDGGENPAPVDSRAMNLMKVLIGND